MTMKNKLMGITAMALSMAAMSTPRSGKMKQDTDNLIKRIQEEIDAERNDVAKNCRNAIAKQILNRKKKKSLNALKMKVTIGIGDALQRPKTKRHGKLIGK